ncbi:impB/mucB/samB family protein [Streptomyces sp. TLI_235]|nr:impB/mucB/samB family protein [Streptomyces sp. TLI_235]
MHPCGVILSNDTLLRRTPVVPTPTEGFPAMQFDKEDVELDGLGGQLRADGQVARALTLTVHYADRSTTTRTRALPEPTAHTPVLAGTAQALHDALGLQRARVTALSLRAEDLTTARLSGQQLTFDRQTESARRLEPVLDRIAARWPGSVGPATLAHP